MAASPRLAHTFPPGPSLELRLEQTPQASQPQPVKVKFDTAFLDRRMREHREMQQQAAAELEYDIIREVLVAYERGRA